MEEAIAAALESDVALLAAAGRHVVGSGGKRVRPRVVLLSYHAAGGREPQEVIALAAAVELLHTASLVHDDINDRSDLRRGRSTVNRLWGDGLALLCGDYIFVKLLELIAPCGSRAVRAIARACVDIVEGETRQMLALGRMDVDEDEYLDVVRQKTASLFSCCAALGAIQAGADAAVEAALAEYGMHLGMAYQIRDDILDVEGSAERLGKPVRADLAQRKMSLATIHARRRAGATLDTLVARDVEGACELLNDTGALALAARTARSYADRAIAALDALPAGEARAALGALADLAAQRKA